MDSATQEQAKEAKIWLLQRDYQKAIKEVKRLAELLKDVGILVD
jgi:hypothetical protein